MSRYLKYTIEQKIRACEDYLSGALPVSEICVRLGMSPKNGMTIYKWLDKYKIWGADAFIPSSKNKSYTREFKLRVVEEYISGQASVREIVAKYNISSMSMLERWISLYNANRELKDYDPKREVYMAEARRKTTMEERKEIVEYCIEHNRDYKGAASKYDVSYSQVYSWVKKYVTNGEEGLTDKRGRHKADDEVDELERLRRENLRLKRQLQEKIRKDVRLGKVRYESKYLAIKYYHVEKGWSIEWMCKQLEISRAAYYKWLHRDAPEQEAENKLKRDFNATAPNEKWSTDVTEFKVPGEKKKLYLSAILDLYDKYPVSYVISCRNDNRLVFRTYDKAIASNPDAKPIFHSDRGFQYTSKVFQQKLKEQEIEQSMSRVGHCIDNGPTEGFLGIIKTEMYQMYDITDEESLRFAINDYMRFYSEERPQDRYYCKTPLEVRTEALASDNPKEYPIPENKRIKKYKEKWCA